MKILTLIISSFFIFGGTLAPGFEASLKPVDDHALYIGVIQIDHKNLGLTAGVNVKVFADDLQSALRNAFPAYEPAAQDSFCAKNGKSIKDYFAGHLQVGINGIAASMSLKDCHRENDVYWLTFDMPCPHKWEIVTISADFFMELFPTQSNVVNVMYGEEKRYFRLTKRQSSGKVEF